ncbi:hypothetical protein KAT36_00865 [Candidatus Pacearchaeota archaeon]|nr:hypothetical protein [Candidatus Pacearchaeota archaeon]
MESYVSDQKSVKISTIFNKESSLSASDFKTILKNTNMRLLSDLLVDVGKGNDMSEEEFVDFDTSSKYLKTASLTGEQFLLDSECPNCFEYINPEKNKSFKINKFRNIQKFDIIYTSTGSNKSIGACALAKNKLNHNFSSHMFKLELKPGINKFYLFALLKDIYGQEACDLEVPRAGLMRRGGKRFLNINIPYPTKKNHPYPKKIEEYVSFMVQNIIDKENQIKIKNDLIEQEIKQELIKNQIKNDSKFNYPKISQIKKEGRLDTGLYGEEFKEINSLIRNYSGGYFHISLEDIKTGQTPKDYYYPKDNMSQESYLWLSPKNIHKNILQKELWVHTKMNNTLKDGDLIFGSRGSVGDIFFYDEKVLGKTYINQSTSGIFIDGEIHTKIFVLCYFSSQIFQKLIKKYVCKGTVPAITPDILVKFLIPNFSKEKQKEISKLYYNKIDRSADLSLDNYLEKEYEKNKDIGIFQLNIEIFQLRKLLREVTERIIKDKSINMDFNHFSSTTNSPLSPSSLTS